MKRRMHPMNDKWGSIESCEGLDYINRCPLVVCSNYSSDISDCFLGLVLGFGLVWFGCKCHDDNRNTNLDDNLPCFPVVVDVGQTRRGAVTTGCMTISVVRNDAYNIYKYYYPCERYVRCPYVVSVLQFCPHVTIARQKEIKSDGEKSKPKGGEGAGARGRYLWGKPSFGWRTDPFSAIVLLLLPADLGEAVCVLFQEYSQRIYPWMVVNPTTTLR